MPLGPVCAFCVLSLFLFIRHISPLHPSQSQAVLIVFFIKGFSKVSLCTRNSVGSASVSFFFGVQNKKQSKTQAKKE
jgi:hypothetical protein